MLQKSLGYGGPEFAPLQYSFCNQVSDCHETSWSDLYLKAVKGIIRFIKLFNLGVAPLIQALFPRLEGYDQDLHQSRDFIVGQLWNIVHQHSLIDFWRWTGTWLKILRNSRYVTFPNSFFNHKSNDKNWHNELRKYVYEIARNIKSLKIKEQLQNTRFKTVRLFWTYHYLPSLFWQW